MPQNLQNKGFKASNKLNGVLRMRMSRELGISFFFRFSQIFLGIGIGSLELIREIYFIRFSVEGFM